MPDWINSSIRNKLLVAVVGLAVLITVVMGGMSYSVGSHALTQRMEISLVNLAEARANEMDIYLSSVARIPVVLAGALESDLIRDEAALSARMERTLVSNPDIYGTAVAFEPYAFDPERKYFSPYWWYDRGVPSYLQFGSDDYVYWEWDWYTAPRAQGRQVWSAPFYDEGAGETLMVTSSVPFYVNDAFTGVATVDVSLEKLRQILQDIAHRSEFDGRGHALLIDAHGQVIAIDEPTLIAADLHGVTEASIDEVSDGSLAAVADRIRSGERGVDRVTSPFGDGVEHFTVSAPLVSTGWHLAILAPADVLLADASTLRDAYFALVVGVLFVAALVAIRIAHYLTEPIVHLTRTVERVAAGDLDVRATVSASDESGVLGRRFNAMTGQLRGLVRNLEDEIEERKNAEQDLRLLSQAIEQSPVSVVITDTAGVIEYVNPQFVGTSGFNSGEVVGSQARLLDCGSRWSEGCREVWRVISSGEQWRGEFRNERKNGEPFWELVSIAGVKDRDGEITHYVLVAEDITRRKQMEQDTLRQERLASVGKLAAGIAHDFNNLLMAILANAELLQHQPDAPDDLIARLAEIIRQGERGARLTSQVLDFSRESVAEFQPLDLKSNLGETLRFIGRTIPASITIDLEFGPHDYTIEGDPAQLQQVITNLAVNARDAMPDGGTLRVELSYADPRPDSESSPDDGVEWICLEVSDTGTGIPPEVLPHIFDPFFSTKEVGQGSGLGLAQTFGIVKSHNGRITVDTREGEGTTFTLYFPALDVAVEPPPDRVESLPMGRGETVLLVEDDDGLLEIVESMLMMLGYRVLTASNGAEALTFVAERGDEIELVVTDAVMPVMGGFELIEALRSQSPDLHVVLMSGYTGVEMPEPEARSDFAAFLTKPVSISRLGVALSEVLRDSRPVEPSRAEPSRAEHIRFERRRIEEPQSVPVPSSRS